MKIRFPFLLGTVNLIAGAFLAVATFAWAPSTVVGLGFAVSIGVAATSALLVLAGLRSRMSAERAGAIGAGAIGIGVAAWTIVETQVFANGLAHWLVFAAGLAYAGLALIDLLTHEISTERVVHHLDVSRERQPLGV